jgi:hypothetical protein
MKHVENMRQKKTYGHPKGVDRPYGTITTSKGGVWDNKSKYRMFFCCMCPIKSKKSEKIPKNIAKHRKLPRGDIAHMSGADITFVEVG